MAPLFLTTSAFDTGGHTRYNMRMAGNTYGTVFRVTTFGESHGAGLGAVIDGCPAGIAIDTDAIQAELNRRRPGATVNGKASAAVTSRSEPDTAEVLSGIFEGKSEGTPIAIVIRNTSQHSKDYGNLARTFRPGHADFTYFAKYGTRDYRGGGRSSGRETAGRVAAGAIARQVLAALAPELRITAYTLEAAGIRCERKNLDAIERNSMRAPDAEAARLMEERVAELRAQGDSAGGIIECVARGVPAGLGEPVFDKLDAELAKAMLSVGAVKGIEFGAGFEAARLSGSTANDAMRAGADGAPLFATNNAGGILGGISSGNDIVFRLAVKPVPSIFRTQRTVTEDGGTLSDTDLTIAGRHDVCLCPRIVPVVEAMCAIVLTDMLLRNRCAR